MNVKALFAALLFLALSSSALAETKVYYYVDENGSYHFADRRLSPRYRPYPLERRSAGSLRPHVPVGLTTAAPDPVEARRINGMIDATCARYGIDADLIRAVVKVESNFNNWAVSRMGARGLMQLMPETARDYGVRDLHDPQENLDAGVRILCELMIRFDGELPLVLSAYNAGLSSVADHAGVPPFPETREYIAQVTEHYLRYRAARTAAP